MSEAFSAYRISDVNRLDYNSTRSVRDREYDTIARVTRDMTIAMERSGARDFPAFVAALKRNRDLWIIFSSDVRSERNGLPNELKAGILYLSEFVRLFTSRALTEDLDIRPLIDINLSVLRGLGERSTSR